MRTLPLASALRSLRRCVKRSPPLGRQPTVTPAQQNGSIRALRNDKPSAAQAGLVRFTRPRMKRRTSLSSNRQKPRWLGALGACLAGLLAITPASATPPMISSPELSPPTTTTGTETSEKLANPSFFSQLGHSQTMLGDMGGIRPFLARYGMDLSILETSEVLGNVSGGTNQGFEYDGLTQMVLTLDTERAFGLHGGTFDVSGLQIHGRNLSADNLDTLQTSSGIEGDRSTPPVGTLVRPEIPRRGPPRREGRPAEPRPGIHGQHQRAALRQHHVRLAHAALRRHARRRPGLSALRSRRALPLSRDRCADPPRRRLQRHARRRSQRRSAAGQRHRHELSRRPGRALHGRSSVLLPLARRHGLQRQTHALRHLQARLLVRHARLRRPGSRHQRRLPRQPPPATASPASTTATTPSTASSTRRFGATRATRDADRTINFFARAMGTPGRGPQPHRLLCERRVHHARAHPHPRRRHRWASAWATPRSATAPRVSTRTPASSATATTPRATPRNSSSSPTSTRSLPGGRFQPDIQYIINPGAGVLNSQTGNAVSNELVLGVRTNINF